MSKESNTTAVAIAALTLEMNGDSVSSVVTVPGGGRLYDIILRSMEERDSADNQFVRAKEYSRNALGIELHLVDGHGEAVAKVARLAKVVRR